MRVEKHLKTTIVRFLKYQLQLNNNKNVFFMYNLIIEMNIELQVYILMHCSVILVHTRVAFHLHLITLASVNIRINVCGIFEVTVEVNLFIQNKDLL